MKSKATLTPGATSSDQSKLSLEKSSSSKPLTMSKKTTINAFLTSRRKFLPDHAMDVRIFFKAIRTYENERAARQQKTAPANGRLGKLTRSEMCTGKRRIEVESPKGQHRQWYQNSGKIGKGIMQEDPSYPTGSIFALSSPRANEPVSVREAAAAEIMPVDHYHKYFTSRDNILVKFIQHAKLERRDRIAFIQSCESFV